MVRRTMRVRLKNPDWTVDELVLALEVYFRLGVGHSTPRKSDPEIVQLSALLNRLPLHEGRSAKFRNPNSVYMKLMNFRRWDPTYTASGKKGLDAGNKLDKVVWDEYAQDLPRLRAAAGAIASLVVDDTSPKLPPPQGHEESEFEAIEGRLLRGEHVRRERCAELVKRKKAAALRAHGRLTCEVCGFDFKEAYGDVGDGFIECHHILPLASLAPGLKTHLKDLALVCANCHRMLHAGRRLLTLEELRGLLLRQKRGANPCA
jgi:5-methylcytosine-specific restriction enzyme A